METKNRTSWYTRYRKKPDGIHYDQNTGRIYEHNGYSKRIFWNNQMLSDLKRMFPTTINEELAAILGVSPRTMLRKARELGLQKDKDWLHAIWKDNRMIAHSVSKKKGYPGCFKKGIHSNPASEFKKGHKPTEEQEKKRSESLKKAWEKRRIMKILNKMKF